MYELINVTRNYVVTKSTDINLLHEIRNRLNYSIPEMIYKIVEVKKVKPKYIYIVKNEENAIGAVRRSRESARKLKNRFKEEGTEKVTIYRIELNEENMKKVH